MLTTLYVHLDGNTVTQFRTTPATEFGNVTAFHLLSEQGQEKHGWHKVSASLPNPREFVERAGDIQVAYDPKRGFTVTREIIPLTEEEIGFQTAAFNAEQKAARARDFASESDPLFMKFQRGDGTRAEWLAKVEEIRARYPYR